MEIMLHKYRIHTPIETIEKAIEISKTLAGGDFGLLTVTFDSVAERKEFREKYKLRNNGEWTFKTRTARRDTTSSFFS